MDIELDQRKGGLTLWHVFHGGLGLVGRFGWFFLQLLSV